MRLLPLSTQQAIGTLSSGLVAPFCLPTRLSLPLHCFRFWFRLCETTAWNKTGMGVTDTLEFVLSCYDFDGTGRLTIDEISLAFKSTVTGMCKLEGASGGVGAGQGLRACPRDVDFEVAAMNAFERRAEESDRFKVEVKIRDFQSSKSVVGLLPSVSVLRLRQTCKFS